MILLHDDGTQERRDESYREETANGIASPVTARPFHREKPAYREHRRKHDGDDGRRKNAINKRIDQHLPGKHFPKTVCGGISGRRTGLYMCQATHPPFG